MCDEKNIKVLVDASQYPFSEMLITALNNVGVKTERLCRPVRSFQLGNFRRLAMWELKLLASRAQIVHYLGGNFPFPFYAIPRLLGKKVVVHWMGTDSLQISSRKLSWTDRVNLRLINLHLAHSPNLVSELSTVGIQAKPVPLVPSKPIPSYMPLGTKVCVYLPENKPSTYGADIIFQVVHEMPDVNFLIIAHSGKNAPSLPNVTYFSWMSQQDMENVWMQTKVLLRLTTHDGCPPVTVMEALLRGRYVIWSFAFPFCLQARSVDDVKTAIRSALACTELNVEGQHYAQTAFDPTTIAEKIKQEYIKLLK